MCEYVAKLVCGLQTEPADMRLTPGAYATTINIHNPNDHEVGFFKKLAFTFPPEEQQPGDVIDIGEHVLRPDGALAAAPVEQEAPSPLATEAASGYEVTRISPPLTSVNKGLASRKGGTTFCGLAPIAP
jgi:hypothetical protein